jgi:hypothetical protein
MFYNGSTNVDAKSKAAAKAMGVDAAAAGNTVNVTVSPTLPGGLACPSCVQVQVATPNPTIFIATASQWIGNSNFNSINVSANAVAGSPGASQTCMYVMDPHASSSLWIHGAGSINAPGCGIYVNSDDPGAFCVTGNAGKSSFAQVAVHGGQDSKGNCGGDPGPPVHTDTGVQSLPIAWQGVPSDPRSNCSTVTSTATLSGSIAGPGYGKYACYANGTCTSTSTTKKGVTTTTYSCTPVTVSSATLGAGIYVFETGVTIKGATTIGANTPTGGATVIVTGNTASGDGGVYDSGTATTFYDYAPQSGTYHGIAIYQPAFDTQQLGLQFGSGSSIFDGAVFAPTAAVDLHDQGGAVNATVLVVGQAYINGKVNLTNYSTYNPNTTPFTHITLVE